MQKTLTINGRRYTGKRIAAMFDVHEMTRGEDYIVTIDGLQFLGNYRQIQDSFFAPVCEPKDATAIALMPRNSKFGYSDNYNIWLSL
jgi:hypothetical protein